MADLPEFKRSKGIEPASASTGFTNALNQLGSAGRQFGDFAYQIASRASMESARQAGLEAAKNPDGRNLLPALNATGDEFNKAYKYEASQGLNYEVSKGMSQLFYTAAKNPSANSLNDFEKHSANLIEENVRLAPEDMRSELGRQMLGNYQSAYYQLAGKVEQKNKEYLQSVDAAQAVENSKNVYNSARIGLVETADMQYHDEVARINSLVQSGQLLPDEALKRKDDLKVQRDMGILDGQVEKAKENGNYSELAKDFRENRPAGLTPLEHDALANHMVNFANQYDAALNASQIIDFNRAQIAYRTGDMAVVETLRESMGEVNRSKFDLAIAKDNAKQNEIIRSNNEISANMDNQDYLNTKKPEQINNWFQAQVKAATDSNGGQAPSLKEQVAIGSTLHIPIPELNKKINNSILNGGPSSSVDAMLAYSNAKGREINALSGVGAEASAKAENFNNHLLAGNDIENAYGRVNEQFLTPAVKEGLDDKWKDITKDRGDFDISDSAKLTNKVQESLELQGLPLPIQLPVLWEQEIRKNFDAARGEMETAQILTKRTMSKNWGKSKANGEEEVFFRPPERNLKDYPLASQFVQNQMLTGFEQMAADTKRLYDEPGSQQPFYYEADVEKVEVEQFNDASYKGGKWGFTRGGTIPIKRVWRTGEVQKGLLKIQGDVRALLPLPGEKDSYLMAMEVNGVNLPLADSRSNFEAFRYYPDYSQKLQDQFTKQEATRKELFEKFRAEREAADMEPGVKEQREKDNQGYAKAIRQSEEAKANIKKVGSKIKEGAELLYEASLNSLIESGVKGGVESLTSGIKKGIKSLKEKNEKTNKELQELHKNRGK